MRKINASRRVKAAVEETDVAPAGNAPESRLGAKSHVPQGRPRLPRVKKHLAEAGVR